MRTLEGTRHKCAPLRVHITDVAISALRRRDRLGSAVSTQHRCVGVQRIHRWHQLQPAHADAHPQRRRSSRLLEVPRRLRALQSTGDCKRMGERQTHISSPRPDPALPLRATLSTAISSRPSSRQSAHSSSRRALAALLSARHASAALATSFMALSMPSVLVGSWGTCSA